MTSVIIPALNEERHSARCIEALRAEGSDCEIIVCVGGSSDMTRDIAIGFR